LRYVEQVASDLEENRRRQQELAEEITMLKQEEALLVDILSLAERYEGLPDPSPLPGQATGRNVLGHGTQVREDISIPSEGAPRASSPTTQRTSPTQSGVRRGKSRQSRLADVLLSLLGGHTEPRLAKELRDELLAKHPDRNPTPQVVRNTIESLVAKGRVHRHKQQRSVTYTLAQSGESDTSSTTEDAD
jgi:hypothetical protein